MVRARHQLAPVHLVDLYLLLSFVVSSFLWLGLFVTQPNFLLHSFFTTTLVGASLIGFSSGVGYGNALLETRSFGGLLLLQFSCLIGAALEYQSTSLVFVATIPCLMACYSMLSSERNLKGGMIAKDLIPPLVGVGAYLGFAASYRGLEWGVVDLLGLSSFVCFSVGTLYWGSALVRRENKSLITSLLRRGNGNWRWRMDNDRQREDRLFFHDVINHTHGLSLFLQQKISGNETLHNDEVKSLLGEVKAMQSLVADHYGFKHKNLLSRLDWVEIDYAMASFHQLIHSHLPAKTEIRCHQAGMLDRERFDRSRLELMVHYPTFLRVCTNLVKNISEHSPRVADFTFEAQENVLRFSFKNKMGHLHEVSKDLDKALSVNILAADTVDEREHLGLESVQVLCADHGGSFEFSIVEGWWVANVELPLKNIKQLQDQTKKAA
ncbi:MAG: hypothetical protein CME71_12005 [Halobacteriovorax sp.]|nr:hypothetical protein [Halobacteriovorax sp.]